MKICFVGQEHYFNCCLPTNIPNTEIVKVDYSWGQDTSKILEQNNSIDCWIFIRGEYVPDAILKQLSGKKIWVSTEPIERKDVLLEIKMGMSKGFDYKVHYDRSHIPILQKNGLMFDDIFQLPVNLELYKPLKAKQKYDFCFCGRSTERREEFMGQLKHLYKFLHVAHGLIDEDYVKVVQEARINLNLHIDNYKQLQHRVQNLLACGCFVMSEELSHQDDLKPWFHYVPINSPFDALNNGEKYLADEKERNRIAKQGYDYVVKNFDANKCWAKLIKEVV